MRRLYQYNVFLLVFAALACVFCTACGLDEFIYLEPPLPGHNPSNITDDEHKYFSFTAQNTANASGSDVYYRIYNVDADRQADMAHIDSQIANNPYNALVYIRDTKKYRRLLSSTRYDTPLIEVGASNVKIRLVSALPTYPASIDVDGLYFGDPKRNITGSSYNDFTISNFESGDEDVQFNDENPIPSEWYIALYAVTVGLDAATMRQFYSKPVYLGFVIAP